MRSCGIKAGFAAFAVTMLLAGSAYAQSSLGIGAAEQPAMPQDTGMFSGFFTWVATEQRAFYKLMTDSLEAMRSNPSAGWALVWLSFLYGILHAAGPGHGKVVISSYMLANETQLRRGVLLSLASSIVQALSAVAIVGLGFLVLRQLSVSVTDTTRGFEIASYAMVIALGAWLLFSKGRKFLVASQPAASLSSAAVHDHYHEHRHHSHDHHHEHDHHDEHGDVCSSCGHAHMPSPTKTGGSFREQVMTVMSVGVRPCTGALVVLTFAFLNELWWAGIVSTFAMALGTAITVSALATLAVLAKGMALRYAGSGLIKERLVGVIEIAGALFILVIGITLFSGAINA